MSESPSNRRKTMLVNKPLQRRIVVSMSLLPAFGLVGALSMVAIYCHRLAYESLVIGVELQNVLPLFMSVSVFLVLSALFILHKAHKTALRVAGPSHRLCGALRRIRGGDVGFRVVFRDGDFLEEVCDEMNQVLDWLNENPPPGVITNESRRRDHLAAGEAAESTDDPRLPALVAAGGVEDFDTTPSMDSNESGDQETPAS